jgi:hypothetical protein
MTTVLVDAVSYLLSAMGIHAIGGRQPRPARTDAPRLRAGDLLASPTSCAKQLDVDRRAQ